MRIFSEAMRLGKFVFYKIDKRRISLKMVKSRNFKTILINDLIKLGKN